MNSDSYSLSLTNLALDGSLDLFTELYAFTYDIYLRKLRGNCWLVNNRPNWNWSAIQEILPRFESVANKTVSIFTTEITKIHLYPEYFKHFDFFDVEKIKEYELTKSLHQKWQDRGYRFMVDTRYLESNNEEFVFQETVGGLQYFLDEFKRILMRVIRDEMQKQNPEYNIFEARRYIETCIEHHMRIKRSECVIPHSQCSSLTNEPLYVFKSLNSISCKVNQHRIIARKYYASHIDGKHIVVLPVHYCETCNRYMIGSLSLSLFRECCGKFVAQIRNLDPGHDSTWCLERESKLHQLGYNVEAGKLTSAQRQDILIQILETKQLSFFEIVNTIEQNIRIFDSHSTKQVAVEKWRTDLKFINEYVANKNPLS